MKTKIYISTILLLGIGFGQLNAQKAFLGGGSSAIMPVANYNNFAYASSIFGSHAGQVKEVVSTSDGSFIYFQSQDAQTLKNRIYKFNAATETYVSDFTAKSYSRNLNITDDDAFLIFHTTSMLYKADANTMQLVDSMALSTVTNNIAVYDANTVFCNTLNQTFKADFGTHSFVDSVINYGNARLAFNQTKTKLYTLREIPSEFNVLSINPLVVDSVVVLQYSAGRPEDVLVNGEFLYIKRGGFSGNQGTLLVHDTATLDSVAAILIGEGTGILNVSPNGKLWVPCGTSQTISIIDIATHTEEIVLSTLDYNNFSACYSVAFSDATITGMTPISKQNSFTMYPNPSNGVIHFTGSGFEKITVYNSLGKMVYSGKCVNVLKVTNLKGLYLIELTNTNGVSSIQRLVIQ